MISDAEKAAISDSWRLVLPIAETASDLFYKKLFELRPDYRRLFPEDMTAQKRKLLAMLSFVVKSLDWPESAWRDTVSEEDDLCLVVLALGRRHSDLYKVPDSSYDFVGQALLYTLDYGLGKKFDAPTRAAWTRVYQLLALTMKMGRLSVPGPNKADEALGRVMAAAANGVPNGFDGHADGHTTEVG
ncbi:MAG: globin domain-containing protein [Polyangiaceae bacterium]